MLRVSWLVSYRLGGWGRGDAVETAGQKLDFGPFLIEVWHSIVMNKIYTLRIQQHNHQVHYSHNNLHNNLHSDLQRSVGQNLQHTL